MTDVKKAKDDPTQVEVTPDQLLHKIGSQAVKIEALEARIREITTNASERIAALEQANQDLVAELQKYQNGGPPVKT